MNQDNQQPWSQNPNNQGNPPYSQQGNNQPGYPQQNSPQANTGYGQPAYPGQANPNMNRQPMANGQTNYGQPNPQMNPSQMPNGQAPYGQMPQQAYMQNPQNPQNRNQAPGNYPPAYGQPNSNQAYGQPNPNQAYPQQFAGPNGPGNSKPPKKGFPVLAVVIPLLVILIGVLVWFFFLKNKKDSKPTNTSTTMQQTIVATEKTTTKADPTTKPNTTTAKPAETTKANSTTKPNTTTVKPAETTKPNTATTTKPSTPNTTAKTDTGNAANTKAQGLNAPQQIGDLKITILSYEEVTDKALLAPEEGNVYVLFKVLLENNSDKAKAISTLINFSTYPDEDTSNDDAENSLLSTEQYTGHKSIDGEIPAKGKVEGYIGCEISADWKKITIVYDPFDIFAEKQETYNFVISK